jgi:large subunit ribosomal protein L28
MFICSFYHSYSFSPLKFQSPVLLIGFIDTGLSGDYCPKHPKSTAFGGITPKQVKSFLIVMIFYGTLTSQKNRIMARVCQVTGKVPITGNRVSHSNIKTKRRFLPNLQTKRFFLAEEDKWITLKTSTEGLRTINKKGLYTIVKELRAQGEKI